MTSARDFIIHLLTMISDHGNTLISKAVHYFGIASVGGGVAIGATTDTMSRIATPEMWQLSDWAVVISMVGGLTFIIKNLVDVYFKIKNKGKD